MKDQRSIYTSHTSLVYPVWADDDRHIILLLAVLGLIGGAGGAVLLHCQVQWGLYLVPLGIAGVLGYGKFYLQELYHRYLACGWDMYF